MEAVELLGSSTKPTARKTAVVRRSLQRGRPREDFSRSVKVLLTCTVTLCCLISCESVWGTEGDATRPGARLPAKARRFAAYVVKRCDVNGDGVLQADEWRLMNGRPELVDRNSDGLITLEEYELHLARSSVLPLPRKPVHTNRQNQIATGEDKGGEASSDPNSTPGGDVRRSLRYHVDRAKLPASTPAWFVSLDGNGDVQLSLSEFLSGGRTITEFRKLDRSGDGLLTVREIVAADRR